MLNFPEWLLPGTIPPTPLGSVRIVGKMKMMHFNERQKMGKGEDNPNWRGGKVGMRCAVCDGEFMAYLSQNPRSTCSMKCAVAKRVATGRKRKADAAK